ncbi:MAG TPA: hypothetical protein VKK31_27750 [Thermoanaerobaculia bacterium]|nr:hypothetical protein [Thermoanaerobaculia bacterium]
MKLTSRALNTCLIASLAFPISAWVSADDFSGTARKKLLQAARSFTNQGYRLLGAPHVSHLDRQATERIDIVTTRGVSYALISVCDEYCSGLDLALLNDEGGAVDVERKDRSIVTVTPRTTAPVSLRVTMTDCSEEPCHYGIGIFAK